MITTGKIQVTCSTAVLITAPAVTSGSITVLAKDTGNNHNFLLNDYSTNQSPNCPVNAYKLATTYTYVT
jgi:hypothetical protein